MSAGAQARMLPDGERLHLHHGPIDLICGADGPGRKAALARAAARFQTVLAGLVAELPRLRRPLDGAPFHDPVARRMARAVARHRGFVTPMAAVAGAVADAVLAAMRAGPEPLTKAYVNNGGDVALHLTGAQDFTALSPAGTLRIAAHDPSRGVASSGWRGRSHSLGIADCVTVLAKDAAAADVAATLIANAVDLPGHSAITRDPASMLSPDSDLGTRLVTTAVGQLSAQETTTALAAGVERARAMAAAGLIHDAALLLNGQVRTLAMPDHATQPKEALNA